MVEVVINTCYGGFGLSKEGMLRYSELKGVKFFSDWSFDSYYTLPPECRTNEDSGSFSSMGIKRDDPALVQTVKDLGAKANGSCAELKIVEIPNDVEWVLKEHDGKEWVEEAPRTWE